MNFYSAKGYFTDTVMDWLRYKTDGKTEYTVVLAARLSGVPHIGTLVNFMSGYSLAAKLQSVYNKKVQVIIELLDNISDDKLFNIMNYNDKKYYHKRLINNDDFLNANYHEFCEVINRLNSLYQLPVKIKTYQDIIEDPEMRRSIIQVIEHQESFVSIFNPRGEKYLHLRIACPHCGLLEKSCRDTQIEKTADGEYFINSICPEHGPYGIYFSAENKEYLEINAPFRQFCKGLSLVDHDTKNSGLSIQVLGNDWSGGWGMRMFCEGMFCLKREQLPLVLFSPVILADGRKISKSDLKGSSENRDIFYANRLHNDQLLRLHDEIEKWFQNSGMFFDNYNVKYLEGILKGDEEI